MLIFLNSDVTCACTWQQCFIVLKNIYVNGYCIIVRRSYPDKYFPA